MKRNGRSAHAKLAWAMAGAGLSILAPSAAALADQPVASLVDDAPVVVELFTSQGCNSCPPADALLGRLAERKDLLPLAFHVDYWNYLGWKDPFSSGLATDRQKSYSRVLDVMVYTPQMVIDGAKDAVGSDEAAVGLAIDAEKVRPKLKLAVLRDGQGRYRIAIPADGAAAQASVYVALFDHSHQTPVGRGEFGPNPDRVQHRAGMAKDRGMVRQAGRNRAWGRFEIDIVRRLRRGRAGRR